MNATAVTLRPLITAVTAHTRTHVWRGEPSSGVILLGTVRPNAVAAAHGELTPRHASALGNFGAVRQRVVVDREPGVMSVNSGLLIFASVNSGLLIFASVNSGLLIFALMDAGVECEVGSEGWRTSSSWARWGTNAKSLS